MSVSSGKNHSGHGQRQLGALGLAIRALSAPLSQVLLSFTNGCELGKCLCYCRARQQKRSNPSHLQMANSASTVRVQGTQHRRLRCSGAERSPAHRQGSDPLGSGSPFRTRFLPSKSGVRSRGHPRGALRGRAQADRSSSRRWRNARCPRSARERIPGPRAFDEQDLMKRADLTQRAGNPNSLGSRHQKTRRRF